MYEVQAYFRELVLDIDKREDGGVSPILSKYK